MFFQQLFLTNQKNLLFSSEPKDNLKVARVQTQSDIYDHKAPIFHHFLHVSICLIIILVSFLTSGCTFCHESTILWYLYFTWVLNTSSLLQFWGNYWTFHFSTFIWQLQSNFRLSFTQRTNKYLIHIFLMFKARVSQKRHFLSKLRGEGWDEHFYFWYCKYTSLIILQYNQQKYKHKCNKLTGDVHQFAD